MSETHLPLFVYGTLRPGASQHKIIQPYIAPNGIQSALLKGYQMYSFGAYPALIPSTANRVTIQGELLQIRLDRYEECFQCIDQYERNGWAFERIMDYVIPSQRTLLPAWVYIAKANGLPLDRAKPFPSHDWLQVEGA